MAEHMTRRVFLASSVLAGLGLSQSHAMELFRGSQGGKVLVAGASGQTGLHIMAILQDESWTMRGLTTNVDRAKAKVPDRNYDWVAVDVRQPESMVEAFEGVDYLISAIGSGRNTREGINPETIDYGGVKNLVDLAVARGLKHFVLISSSGATIDDPEHYFNRMSGNSLIWKFKGEEYLRASGLSYTIVRPGNLNLKDRDYAPGTRGLVFDQGDRIFGTRSAVIHRADLAAVCVAALGDENSIGKTFEIYADENKPVGDWRNGGFAQLSADS